jgi:RNA polymerase sigma-70 factor (ECF subfamily)
VNEDAELVQRIRAGATEEFAELVRRHQSRVFAILHHYERDAQRVEDLAQETFLKAWRALLDHLRHQKRRKNEMSLAELGDDALDWLRSGDETSEIDARNAGEILSHAMRELSPNDRVVLTMQELEGHSFKEIAAATGASVIAVRVRAMRARTRLKRALEKIWDYERQQA